MPNSLMGPISSAALRPGVLALDSSLEDLEGRERKDAGTQRRKRFFPATLRLGDMALNSSL